MEKRGRKWKEPTAVKEQTTKHVMSDPPSSSTHFNGDYPPALHSINDRTVSVFCRSSLPRRREPYYRPFLDLAPSPLPPASSSSNVAHDSTSSLDRDTLMPACPLACPLSPSAVNRYNR